MKELKLICGNPEGDHAASFTRFVLPFQYELDSCSEEGGASQHFYERWSFIEKRSKDYEEYKWREQYLTSETAEVLFKSAKWFVLNSKRFPKKINLGRSSKVIKAQLLAPIIVLFEFRDAEKRKVYSERPDLLQTGLLIQELFFSSFLLEASDLKGPCSLARKLCKCESGLPLKLCMDADDPAESEGTIVRFYKDSSAVHRDELSEALLKRLNNWLQDRSPVSQDDVCGVSLSYATQQLLDQKPRGEDLRRLKRLLLEDAFPVEIVKCQVASTPNLDDLLEINELFRYYKEPYENHHRKRLTRLIETPNLRDLLPEEPVSSSKDIHKCYEALYHRWESLLDCRLIWRGRDGKPERLKLNPTSDIYPDTRAFVWTCAILQNGAQELWPIGADAGQTEEKYGDGESVAEGLEGSRQLAAERMGEKGVWRAQRYGHWIKLLNLDRPGDTPEYTKYATEFERKWAKEHTYHRWEQWGTYYGFTPHSGAMLAPPLTDPPLWKHFGQMYFDQMLLLLYVRVVLFRFSKQLSDISAEARNREGGETDRRETWTVSFEKLRWDFALFTNLYQFPLLSNQQQAVEMYTLARRCMDVDNLFKEVQEEINSSHDYLLQVQNQEQTKMTTILSVVATFGLTLALLFAFFSMPPVEQMRGLVGSWLQQFSWLQRWRYYIFVFAAVFGVTGYIFWNLIWLYLYRFSPGVEKRLRDLVGKRGRVRSWLHLRTKDHPDE